MHLVHSMKQGEGDSMDNFYVRIKDEVDKMKLTDLNTNEIVELIILSQLMNNTHNTSLKEKAIKDNQSLQQFREFARTSELTDQQLSGMTLQETTNYVKKKVQKDSRTKFDSRNKFKSKKFKKGTETKESMEAKPRSSGCAYCGETCERGKCPAFGKKCAKCNKWNHVAKVSKSQNKPRRIHQVTEDFDEENDDLDSDGSIYQLQESALWRKQPYLFSL